MEDWKRYNGDLPSVVYGKLGGAAASHLTPRGAENEHEA